MNKEKLKKSLLFILIFFASIIAINTTNGFIAAGTEDVDNTFKPYEFAKNDIIINKTVEHPYGEYYELPNKLLFTFKVDFGKEYAEYEFNTSIGKLKTDSNGIVEITVKPDEPLTIREIDEGTKIKVTEVQDKPGFTVKGNIVTKEVTVTSTGLLTITFTNVYTPAPAKLENFTLTGEKNLEGRDWREGDKFSFELEQLNSNNEWEFVARRNIEYNKEDSNFNKFDFNSIIQNIKFTTIGTYYFRISEVIGEDDNIDYDKNINYFAIKVTDEDMNGTLDLEAVEGFQNITVDKKDKGYNINVKFNNRFKIENVKDLEVFIKTEKTIKNTGQYELGPDGFTLILTDTKTNETKSLLTNSDGIAIFGVTYTKDDIGKTYEYTIHELNDNKSNVTYTDKVYDVKVTIGLNNKDELTAELTVDGKDIEENKIVFENIYHKVDPVGPTDDLNVQITAKKTVKNIGDFEISPEGFTFTIRDTTSGIEQNRTSDKDGNIVFDLNYTKDNVGQTYHYTITEVNDNRKYVQYSDQVHYVDVEIYFNDNDKLSAKVSVNDEEASNITPSFENIYNRTEEVEQDSVKVIINIINRMTCLDGCELGPDNFRFRLEEIDTEVSKSDISDKHGKAHINLKYTEDDIGKTYKYNLYTVDEKKTGITYDTKVYIIEISVREENGKIVLDYKVDGEKVSNIEAIFNQTCYATGDVVPGTSSNSELGQVIQILFFTVTLFSMLILLETNREINLKNRCYVIK